MLRTVTLGVSPIVCQLAWVGSWDDRRSVFPLHALDRPWRLTTSGAAKINRLGCSYAARTSSQSLSRSAEPLLRLKRQAEPQQLPVSELGIGSTAACSWLAAACCQVVV
jgi:hypothetical protein